MATLELYGKCKELGYCDCGGFFSCKDPNPPLAHTDDPIELRNAMEAERQTSDYRNSNLARLIDCTVCDRSHTADHPHIANIDGDEPVDHEPAPSTIEETVGRRPIGRADLPEWLTDRQADDDKKPQLCKVCGKPWAPQHECNPAEATATKKHVTPYHMRKYAKCDVCGLVKRMNHKCKGPQRAEPPVQIAKPCKSCEALGGLCAPHGGVWSDYDTPKGGERVARQLPEPVPVTISAPAPTQEVHDPELLAMAAIVKALEGMDAYQMRRIMSYLAARFEEAAS